MLRTYFDLKRISEEMVGTLQISNFHLGATKNPVAFYIISINRFAHAQGAKNFIAEQ